MNAQVAQLVEHMTENHGVGGSIPSLGTTFPDLAKNFAMVGLDRASNMACAHSDRSPAYGPI